MTPIIETNCKFTHEGKTYQANGACLDERGGIVYITMKNGHLIATEWNGRLISANVHVVSKWKQYSHGVPYQMCAIRFSVSNMTYSGRYSSDWSQACKVKRVKT